MRVVVARIGTPNGSGTQEQIGKGGKKAAQEGELAANVSEFVNHLKATEPLNLTAPLTATLFDTTPCVGATPVLVLPPVLPLHAAAVPSADAP